MRSRHSQKDTHQPNAAPTRQQAGLRFDWTLLLYPVFILAALVVLYLVNHSIDSELPPSSGSRPAARNIDSGRTDQALRPEDATATDPIAADATPVPQAEESTKAFAAPKDRALLADRTQSSLDIDQLQGTDRTLAMLALATHENDHAGIKECLDELVALGDEAVIPLIDLLSAESEAGLWAAEALARIGTPMATTALFETLTHTQDGEYKDELGRRASAIGNHDSWPLLLDSLLQTEDGTVARAAMTALAGMADRPIIDEVIARYDVAETEAEFERLARLVSNIHSPNATSALLALAGEITSSPQDSLQAAAIDALARVGDAQSVSHLIRRLEASPLGEGADIYNAITQIRSPDAYSHLLHAAAGNKEVSAESGRTAAIQALGNYPSEETIALLERIVAQEANEKVVTAASRTLHDIRQAGHTVVAKDDILQKSEERFPLPPLIK
jgi:HEAT repeat protein